MKIVINSCYGGFSLSKKAEHALALENVDLYDPDRADPRLVEIVEFLGKEANGTFAELTIVDIPAGTKYRITEYDGYEGIQYADEVNWSVAT
jgi:hypothetical protein